MNQFFNWKFIEICGLRSRNMWPLATKLIEICFAKLIEIYPLRRTKYIEINRNMQPSVAKYVAFGHEIYGNRLKFIEICRDL